MGYAKERGKLELLSKKASTLEIYDDKNVKIITDIFEQYSHSVRILKNKNPEAFTTLYQNDLEQVKVLKRASKDSEEADRQDSFIKYKNGLVVALDNAVKVSGEAW